MAFTDPTATDLTKRFPAFDCVESDVIETALGEASSQVDDSWVSEADFKLGKMLYAAHILTCDGLGATIEAAAAQAGEFSEYRSGDMTLKRATQHSTSTVEGDDWLRKTSYGQRFIRIRQKSVPSVMVVC